MYRQMLYHDKLSFRTPLESRFLWNLTAGWWGWDLLGWLAGQLCIDPSCTKRECARHPYKKRSSMNEGNKIWSGLVMDRDTRFGDGWACFLIEGSSWWGRIPVVSFCTRRRMACHGNMMQRILGGDHLGLCLFCVFSRWWETSCKSLM